MRQICVMLMLALGVIVLTAAAPSLTSAAAPTTGSILLLLTTPRLPAATPAESVPSAFYQAAYEQAGPLLPVLNSLKRSGHIAGYELVSNANAIRVDKPDSTAMLVLSRLPEVNGTAAAGAASVKAARSSFNASMIQTRRLAPRSAQRRSQPHPTDTAPGGKPQATWDFVDLHETWDFVDGVYKSPPADVTVDLYDSGDNLKQSKTVPTGGDGYFFAQFDRPNGDVVPGDYAKLSVNSTVLATVHADAIKIDFDYAQDHVTVVAAANRTLRIWAHDPGAGNCSSAEGKVEVTTDDNGDGTGDYVYDLQGIVDITPRSEADVQSVEDLDNSLLSSVYRHAPFARVNVNLSDNGGNGYALQPGDDLTITLKDASDNKKDSVTLTSNDPDASFGFRFNNADILPGDTVYVDEKGSPLFAIPIVTLSTTINPTTDLVTGQAPGNKQITVNAGHYNRASGSWEGACQTIITPPTGLYSINFGKNFVGRDPSEAYYVNGDGLELYAWDVAPYLEMNKGNYILGGAFHWNFDGEVAITVKTAGGVTRYQGKGYAFGGRWEQLIAKNGNAVVLNTGDRVTAKPTPAVGNLNGTVAKLTANIDTDKDKITGIGPNKAHIAVFAMYWNGGGWDCHGKECYVDVTTGPTGEYEYKFQGDLKPGDFVSALSADAAGNQTIAWGYSATPTIAITSSSAVFRLGRQNEVKYDIGNAVHVTDTYLGLDKDPAPDLIYLDRPGPEYTWPGGSGTYTVNVGWGTRGMVYFRAFAYVDGRWIFTKPEKSARAR